MIIDNLPDDTLAALENVRSPQALAYKWLGEHPTLDLLPEWRKRQLLAIVSIYYSVYGAETWTTQQQTNYLNYNVRECQWGWNTCDFSGHIITLRLECPQDDTFIENSRDLVRLPPEIALLTSLRSLRVNDCKTKKIVVSSFLPATLATLNTTLTTLDLYNNNVHGQLLPSGPIPSLTKLTSLSLDFNVLSGPVPSELGELTALQYLSLAWNSFEGSIPSEIGRLSQLTTLRLYTTQLEGRVASELAQLTQLTSLELQINELRGTLPAGFCTTIPSLTMLRLDCGVVACPSGCSCTCGP